MRRVISVTIACVVLVLFTAAPSVRAQQQPDKPSMQEMMKKWQEAITPGPHHKALEPLVGTWDAECKFWMGGPDAPPSVTHGTATMTLILGGRYLQQDFTGEVMGKPYHGMDLTGYDNVEKKYVGIWVDDMGTGIATMDGTFNSAGTILTMYGKMDEVMTGQMGKNVRYVTTVVSKDKQVFETFDLTLENTQQKTMEITYTRKK